MKFIYIFFLVLFHSSILCQNYVIPKSDIDGIRLINLKKSISKETKRLLENNYNQVKAGLVRVSDYKIKSMKIESAFKHSISIIEKIDTTNFDISRLPEQVGVRFSGNEYYFILNGYRYTPYELYTFLLKR